MPVPSLSESEQRQIEHSYHAQRASYEQLWDYVNARCLVYRQRYPKSVRVVFSREPRIKTLESVIQKIKDRRKDSEFGFGFNDLSDLVAFTVLCSYASDIPPFLLWLRENFDVTPNSDDEAYREYDSGHRGYHFVLSLTSDEAVRNAHLDSLRCELQVKTIVQEAFDAKSHDLAYKPGHLETSSLLKNQFAVLSAVLQSIDRQSEFLKTLILREEEELNLRKNACMVMYFRKFGEIPSKADLDPKNLPNDPKEVFRKLKQISPVLSAEFCKFAAFCALKMDNEFLHKRCLDWVNDFVKQDRDDPKRFTLRGAIRWAFRHYEEAIQDMEDVINWTRPNPPDAVRIRRAKNNLVYFVCDCHLFKHSVPQEWLDKARIYIADLQQAEASELDTMALFKILWGETAEDIDAGRKMLRDALDLIAKEDPAEEQGKNTLEEKDKLYAFYSLHNHLALTRLLKISRSESGF